MMTFLEKQAWLSLAISVALITYLTANMMDGGLISDQEPRHLWRTWLTILFASTLAEWGLGAWSHYKRRKQVIEDERDTMIKLRAERIGYYVAFCGLNILIWHLLWNSTVQAHIPNVFDLTQISSLFFCLMLLMLLNLVGKQAAIIILGRL
jgi:hypothetical protein